MKLHLPSGTTGFVNDAGHWVCTGSQFGRRDELPDDRLTVRKLRLTRLPFVDGDYDRWGAYWGSPANLWCAFRADAIRHLKGAAAAYENLAGVIGKFPASPLVKYNLGCYACVGGKLFSARKLLIQMFRLAQVTDNVIFFRNLAQTDEDLRPLWPEISRIKEIAFPAEQNENENYYG